MSPFTAAERQVRYRWHAQLVRALDRAAELLDERPEHRVLPVCPLQILEHYGLRQKGGDDSGTT